MAKNRTRRDSKTGAIYRDGRGWRVQILLGYDPASGKPIAKKVRAATHEAAVEALYVLQQSSRTNTLAAPTGLTLARYAEEWLEQRVKPSKAPKTFEQRRWVLNQHILPTLGKKRLDKVTRREVQVLVSSLANQTAQLRSKNSSSEPRLLGRRTLEVAVATLHALYRSAIKDGLAGANPAKDIDLPQAQQKRPQFLTPDQLAKLLASLEGSPVRELVRFMLATGTRVGEATGLRWQDVDLSNRLVRISGQLQRVGSQLTYRPTTKTNQDRTLTIHSSLAEDFQNVKASQMIHGWSDPDGIVFLNPYGRRMDSKYVNQQLQRACRSAGIPPVSPHKLRHTAATLALMETGDLHAVQKLLGHKQVALTSNLYGHATAERLRPVTDALGKLLQG